MDRQEKSLQSLPDWVPQVRHSISGIIVNANQAFVELIGYSVADLARGDVPPLTSLTTPKEQDLDQRYLDRAKATGEPVFWQKYLCHRNGTRVLVLFGTRIEPDDYFNSIAIPAAGTREPDDKLIGNFMRRDDEEKRNLARKLHDATVQNLAALAINLSILPTITPESPQVKPLLEECNALITDSLAEIRGISYRLHPPLLEELGLFLALRAYTEAYTKSTGISISIDIPILCSRPSLAIEAALFRIVQERLTYLESYGDATECHIKWECIGQSNTLTITDDSETAPDPTGVSDSPQRLSFDVLHERADTIKATLAIEKHSRSTIIHAIIARS